jgi:ribosomal protein S18 acetylase RimI-like enzyme
MVTQMTVSLRRPRDAEYDGWVAAEVAGYANQIVESGAMSREAADERSRRDHAELLPQGLATPGHLIFRIDADGQSVGWLWLAMRDPRSEAGVGYIYDIEVDEAFRGRGYGRAAMALAEEEARRNGLRALGLNVFGHNAAARALYSSLGYHEIAVQMRKAL